MTRHIGPRPYPLPPLLEAAGGGTRFTARRIGIDHAVLTRAATNGLSERQADTYAVALGLHPLDIWGRLWLCDDLPTIPVTTHHAS